MEEQANIPSGDGSLSATLYQAANPRAVAVLNPATGVPQSYYRHFARWLAADRDITCLTYDYRGFGASATGPARAVTLRMSDWGLTDTQAARDWLSESFPELPLWVIGHSLGALMAGYQARQERIARMIAVAAGPVHVRDHPWPYQALARLYWYGLGPALVAATGYVPGRLSGLGADIPGPVFRQWKAWCTTPGFFASDASLPPYDPAGLSAPLRLVAFSDDVMIPPPVVGRLAGLYPAAEKQLVTLDPADFGLGKVGHLSGFARRNAALWPAILGD